MDGLRAGARHTLRAAMNLADRPYRRGLATVLNTRTGEYWQRRGGSWFKIRAGWPPKRGGGGMKALRLDSHLWGQVARDHALYEQRGRCFYCISGLPRAGAQRLGSTIQHRLNIAAACEPCNLAKGAIEERLFLRMLRGEIPALTFAIALRGTIRRLNRRADRAVGHILRVAGAAP